MAVRRFDLEAGEAGFAFQAETEPKIAFWLAKYPEDKKRSAVIPLLWLAQKDNRGWLSEPAMRDVADRLEMPYIRVYEVATFYTMFRLQPVGQHHIQLCGTTPCMLRGAEDLKTVCQEIIGAPMQVTDDQRLSWEEVECLGACANAPMVQINDYYYEDLTTDSLTEILNKLQNGVTVAPGTFVDRLNSAPEGEITSLNDAELYNGARNSILTLPNTPEASAGMEIEIGGPDEAETSPKTTLIEVGKAIAKALPNKEAELTGEKPEVLQLAAGEEDNLKRIKGIGPVNETALNDLGIYKFSQIAAWTPENIEWVEGYLSFPGRIAREDWIAQAIKLAEGEATEFSKRVDAGEFESSLEEGEES